jgi:hypothetical protein
MDKALKGVLTVVMLLAGMPAGTYEDAIGDGALVQYLTAGVAVLPRRYWRRLSGSFSRIWSGAGRRQAGPPSTRRDQFATGLAPEAPAVSASAC